MSRIDLGVICGLVFGGLDAAMMIPLSFPDKRAALLGAFIARFGLGFVICNVKLPWPGWIVGLLLGILLSLPDAIITKAMIPILVSGSSWWIDHWSNCREVRFLNVLCYVAVE